MGELDPGKMIGHRQKGLLQGLSDPVFRLVEPRVLQREGQCRRGLLQEVELPRSERRRLPEAICQQDTEDLVPHDQRHDHQRGDAELLHHRRVDPVVVCDVVHDEGLARPKDFHGERHLSVGQPHGTQPRREPVLVGEVPVAFSVHLHDRGVDFQRLGDVDHDPAHDLVEVQCGVDSRVDPVQRLCVGRLPGTLDEQPLQAGGPLRHADLELIAGPPQGVFGLCPPSRGLSRLECE